MVIGRLLWAKSAAPPTTEPAGILTEGAPTRFG